MAKTYGVGVIGVGGIANTHFPGWNESPYTELVALSDTVPETLERVGGAQGVTRLYEKAKDLINDPNVDIVDICTPNAFHTPLAVAALQAGKHVICEKPLAPTPADIRKMIKARDESGKLLMTAQHFRFQDRSRALKAEVDRGLLGEVYHARSWMLRRCLTPLRPGFYLKELSNGGPCIDISVHILDLTLWMMGNPAPATVSGVTTNRLTKQPGAFSMWGGTIPAEHDVEEMAAAFVRFESGATLMLEVSWQLHHDTMGEDMQMWLYGDKAGVHWPSNVSVTAINETQQLTRTELQKAQGREPHAEECMVFADCVANGKPSPVPAEQSLQVIGILNALYQSAEKGKEVAVRL